MVMDMFMYLVLAYLETCCQYMGVKNEFLIYESGTVTTMN